MWFLLSAAGFCLLMAVVHLCDLGPTDYYGNPLDDEDDEGL